MQVASIFASFCLITPAMAQEKQAAVNEDSPILCQGRYQTEQEAKQQLERIATTYTNRAEWEARAAKLRKQIFVGARLDSFSGRTPLNVILRNKREYG